MKKLILILSVLLLAGSWSIEAQPTKRSQNIVYIDGVKYYIHLVKAGETLYGIAQTYGVSEEVVRSNNPAAADGLRSDQTLKIPMTRENTPRQEISAKEIKRQRKEFTEHIVAPGETLYAISRRYAISVDTILEDNPDTDPAHLAVDTRLRIRKAAIGHTDDGVAQSEMERYGERMNEVTPTDGYRYHVVRPKETIYSLSRRYGMSEAELIALNHLQGGLQAGAILKVKAPEEVVAMVGEETSTPSAKAESPMADSTMLQRPEVEFTALRHNQRLSVALLLPLSVEGRANRNFTEFYQGFLLGLEDVKARGYSVDLTLFNTERDTSRIQQILQEEAFREARLIIGPVYADGIEPVLRYAEQAEVPVVTPLADLSEVQSDVLFQMAPPEPRKYDKLQPLLQQGAAITLIRTPNVDREFEREILKQLEGYSYQYYDYESVQGVENAERSDLTPLLEQSENHLFFVLPNNEVEVDRVLASLASAHTNMVARSLGKADYTVVGSTRWNRYTNIDRTTFFKNDVVLFSIFHAKRDAEVVRNLDTRYIRIFGAMPSLYAYRGYETAMIFCPGMFSDIEYDMEGRRYRPLQTSYTFGQEPGTLSHVNREWSRVRYNPDFTISVE